MAEWSMAAVLKTAVQQCTVGSNPTLSAIFKQPQICFEVVFFALIVCQIIWQFITRRIFHFRVSSHNVMQFPKDGQAKILKRTPQRGTRCMSVSMSPLCARTSERFRPNATFLPGMAARHLAWYPPCHTSDICPWPWHERPVNGCLSPSAVRPRSVPPPPIHFLRHCNRG